MDGRDQHKNKRKALKLLDKKVDEHLLSIKQKKKNEERLYKIHNTTVIRTYDFKSGMVKNHITGKKASLRQVLYKGNIGLINE